MLHLYQASNSKQYILRKRARQFDSICHCLQGDIQRMDFYTEAEKGAEKIFAVSLKELNKLS